MSYNVQFQQSIFSISASTVLSTWNTGAVIFVDTSAGDVTITLPTPAGNAGRSLTVKKVTADANSVIVVPSVGSVDDETSFTMNNYLNSAVFTADGTSNSRVQASSFPSWAFLYVTRQTTTQVIAAAGTDIIFNTILRQNGITYDNTTGIATLPGGNTYYMAAALNFDTMNGGVEYSYVNTSNTVIGNSQATEALEVTSGNANASANNLTLIHSPSTDEQVKVRVTATAGNPNTLRSDLQSFWSIIQVPN